MKFFMNSQIVINDEFKWKNIPRKASCSALNGKKGITYDLRFLLVLSLKKMK